MSWLLGPQKVGNHTMHGWNDVGIHSLLEDSVSKLLPSHVCGADVNI